MVFQKAGVFFGRLFVPQLFVENSSKRIAEPKVIRVRRQAFFIEFLLLLRVMEDSSVEEVTPGRLVSLKKGLVFNDKFRFPLLTLEELLVSQMGFDVIGTENKRGAEKRKGDSGFPLLAGEFRPFVKRLHPRV